MFGSYRISLTTRPIDIAKEKIIFRHYVKNYFENEYSFMNKQLNMSIFFVEIITYYGKFRDDSEPKTIFCECEARSSPDSLNNRVSHSVPIPHESSLSLTTCDGGR